LDDAINDDEFRVPIQAELPFEGSEKLLVSPVNSESSLGRAFSRIQSFDRDAGWLLLVALL